MYRMQELYTDSRASSGAVTPQGPPPNGAGVPPLALNQALAARPSFNLDGPGSPRGQSRMASPMGSGIGRYAGPGRTTWE